MGVSSEGGGGSYLLNDAKALLGEGGGVETNSGSLDRLGQHPLNLDLEFIITIRRVFYFIVTCEGTLAVKRGECECLSGS